MGTKFKLTIRFHVRKGHGLVSPSKCNGDPLPEGVCLGGLNCDKGFCWIVMGVQGYVVEAVVPGGVMWGMVSILPPILENLRSKRS